MTQKTLKPILNFFLKSVKKNNLNPPKCNKCYTFLMKASLFFSFYKMKDSFIGNYWKDCLGLNFWISIQEENGDKASKADALPMAKKS